MPQSEDGLTLCFLEQVESSVLKLCNVCDLTGKKYQKAEKGNPELVATLNLSGFLMVGSGVSFLLGF